ncbi:hypothetical protein SAMN05216224_10676 [Thioclava dalianensis]|nr:hypothetical protein SAMN05216224_10676 [Thioclava dalianensis]
MIDREREEDLETLLHHLRAAQRIIGRLRWRGALVDGVEALIKKSQGQLRNLWRDAQSD